MSNSSLLWSIQSPEGVSSFLFGTMHIRDDRAYQFCSRLYPFIDQVDVYVGEMDLGSIGSLSAGPAYAMQQHFRPDAYRKLKKQLVKSFNLNIDHYSQMHPLLIMSALTHQVLQKDHSISLDEQLWNYAKTNNLTTIGLETVDEQVSLLHSIAPDKLYGQIKEVGARPSLIRKFTNKTLDLYVQGKIHALYELTKKSMQHLRKRIIYSRNRRMVERIASFDPGQRYFIAIGAGHLSGKSGLISALRKKNWLVRPVIL